MLGATYTLFVPEFCRFPDAGAVLWTTGAQVDNGVGAARNQTTAARSWVHAGVTQRDGTVIAACGRLCATPAAVAGAGEAGFAPYGTVAGFFGKE